MAEGPQRTVALGTTAAAGLLLLAAPTPAASLRTLSAGGSASDQAAPLLALLALIAWALAAWLAATVLLTAGGRLPGQVGRALQSLARRIAPATVRRGVEVALGLTVVVGLASPAAAAPGSQTARSGSPPVASLDGAAPATPSLDWSAGPTAEAAAPDLDWSATADTATPAPAASPTQPALTAPTSPGTDHVVVQPGDTLWGLAERDLSDRSTEPAGAGTGAPTNQDIAEAWPAWWSANREAVGDDPDLLQPGTALARPGKDSPSPG